MTQEQTRKLGIEFERRLYEINSEFALSEKLDTDTIYSFLSEFQYQYIKALYLGDQEAGRGTRQSKSIQNSLKTLIRRSLIMPTVTNADTDNYNALFKIPSDYYLYIRSNSNISSNYKDEKIIPHQVVANIIVKQDDVQSIISTSFNQNNIMRNPAVVLETTDGDCNIKVIHDSYTKIESLELTYYCQPYAFNVINYDDLDNKAGAVHSKCELPYSCFEDIVSGAVNLYIQQYKYKLQSGKKQNQQQTQTNE